MTPQLLQSLIERMGQERIKSISEMSPDEILVEIKKHPVRQESYYQYGFNAGLEAAITILKEELSN